MARVTIATVNHVAQLAHLSLTEQERSTFAQQLDQILEYAESIQALDTEGVAAMSHPLGTDSFREDAPVPSLPRARVLDEAPDASDGFFRVPRIIG